MDVHPQKMVWATLTWCWLGVNLIFLLGIKQIIYHISSKDAQRVDVPEPFLDSNPKSHFTGQNRPAMQAAKAGHHEARVAEIPFFFSC